MVQPSALANATGQRLRPPNRALGLKRLQRARDIGDNAAVIAQSSAIKKFFSMWRVQLSEWSKRDVKLVQAIQKADTDRIEFLLKGGVDPGRIDPSTGYTAYVRLNPQWPAPPLRV